MERIIIGADHGGYDLKEKIKEYIKGLGYEVEDLGTDSDDSVDYTDYAQKAAKAVQQQGRGILICGTGIGMSIAANRFSGVRAALCHDEETARLAREHNNANILCMGGRILDQETAKKITKVWLETKFSGDQRHKRRLEKIDS